MLCYPGLLTYNNLKPTLTLVDKERKHGATGGSAEAREGLQVRNSWVNTKQKLISIQGLLFVLISKLFPFPFVRGSLQLGHRMLNGFQRMWAVTAKFLL